MSFDPAWPSIRFGEIAEFRNGVNYTAADRGSGVKTINVKDFLDRVSPDYSELDELDASIVPQQGYLMRDDIVFVRSNGNRDLIGRSMYISEAPPSPTTHSAFTIRARVTDRRAFPRFYAYFCRTQAIRKALSLHGSGTNISNLNQEILSSLVVPLPPLSVQRRIVEVLSAYDDLASVNRQKIAVLGELSSRIFTAVFVDQRYELLGVSSPQDRREGKLGDLARTCGRSITPANFPDEQFSYFSFASFDSTREAKLERGDAIMSNKLEVSAPTLLVSKLNPRIPRVWLLAEALPFRMICSTEFVPLQPVDGQSIFWLEACAKSAGFTKYLAKISAGTSTSHQRVQPKDILGYPLLVPPPTALQAAESHLAALSEEARVLREQNVRLRQVSDLLLPHLMSGELDAMRVGVGDIAA